MQSDELQPDCQLTKTRRRLPVHMHLFPPVYHLAGTLLVERFHRLTVKSDLLQLDYHLARALLAQATTYLGGLPPG